MYLEMLYNRSCSDFEKQADFNWRFLMTPAQAAAMAGQSEEDQVQANINRLTHWVPGTLLGGVLGGTLGTTTGIGGPAERYLMGTIGALAGGAINAAIANKYSDNKLSIGRNIINSALGAENLPASEKVSTGKAFYTATKLVNRRLLGALLGGLAGAGIGGATGAAANMISGSEPLLGKNVQPGLLVGGILGGLTGLSQGPVWFSDKINYFDANKKSNKDD